MEHSEILTPNNAEVFVSLLQNLDGWNVKHSTFFEGGLQIEKTRKRKEPISIHFIPHDGRFRKITEESLYNPKIEREYRFWQAALEHFDIDNEIKIGKISKLKSDPSRGYQTLQYLDMPYMGLPLNYSEKILPGTIPQDSQTEFLAKMETMVTQRRIFHPDMNPGNILVRVSHGVPTLFPIDWESGNPKVPENKVQYYAQEQRKRVQNALDNYYPVVHE